MKIVFENFIEQVAFFSYEIFNYFHRPKIMADEDISLNEDQLLDNLDDANGDLLTEVSLIKFFTISLRITMAN